MRAIAAEWIHLFYARPAAVVEAGLMDRCRGVLSPEEIARAERFRDVKAGRLSITARALVRYLLSEYTGRPAASFVFQSNAHGKPRLKSAGSIPGQEDIRFNISHCRGGVICGLCLGREIGVDLENLDRRVNPAVSDRFFSPEEAARIHKETDGAARKEIFLDFWTLKEAYIKAVGRGLGIPLNSFSFNTAGPDVKIQFGQDNGSTDGWQFFRWRPAPGKIAAAAVCTPRPVKLRTFYCIPFKEIIDG